MNGCPGSQKLPIHCPHPPTHHAATLVWQVSCFGEAVGFDQRSPSGGLDLSFQAEFSLQMALLESQRESPAGAARRL